MSLKRFCVEAKRWIAPPEDRSVSRCNAKNCLTCKSLDIDNCFDSFSTGCKFVFNKLGLFTCKTKYVVYLISCVKCGLQYVGQTRQPLHLRINGHRHSIVKDKLNTFLCKHFNNDGHSFDDFRVKIIDCVDHFGLSEEEARRTLDEKEDFYIRTLNTVYPLGLNDRLMGKGRVSNGSAGESVYYGHPVRRRKRGHGIRRSGRKRKADNKDDDQLCDSVIDQLHTFFNDFNFKDCYCTLMTLSNSLRRSVYRKLLNTKSDLLSVFSSFLLKKFDNNQTDVVHESRATFVVSFNSKLVDSINLPSIFGDKRLRRLLPNAVQGSYPPKICYKLCNPIRLKICNYSKFLNDLTMDEARNILSNKCTCEDRAAFVNSSYGHIFTGNLEVIEDPRLRQLMSKGAKFRIPNVVPWSTVKKDLFSSVEEHIVKLARRFGIEANCFDDFKRHVFMRISKRISFVKFNNTERFVSLNSVKDSIEVLHRNFVVSTVDKASGNFAIVCKKYYISVLMNELGVNNSTFKPVGNVTYSPVQETEKTIVERHCILFKEDYNISFDDKCKRLPRIFWIPKLHKNPYKFRFIAGARYCTTKTLSVILNEALTVVRDGFKNYCDVIQKNSGLRYFWSIKSSSEFLEIVNSCNKVFSLQVYDFSTLYTNIGHNDVISHLFQLFDIVFDSDSRKYLCVGWNRSFFSRRTYKGYHCFDLAKFKEAVHFVISEVYVAFGGLVFKQIRGVPMGGNSSPLLADLFLLHCEFVFMKKLVSSKKFGLAKLMSCNTRYIDDLCIFNYKHFDGLLAQIYPDDLIAERNGNNDKCVSYLDVNINVFHDGVHSSVYHKVDDFPFNVVLFTFPESLLPSFMGSTIFAGQVLRYMRICSHLSYVVHKVKITCQLFISRGYLLYDLRRNMEKLLQKNFSLLLKFGLFSSRQLSVHCGMI